VVFFSFIYRSCIKGSVGIFRVRKGFVAKLNWYVSVGIAARLRAGRQGNRGSILGRGNIFLFSVTFRPALGITQLPIHWVPGVVFPGVKRQGREADLHPVPRLRMVALYLHAVTRLNIVVLN
jgi:hypothetical protein